MTGTGTDVEPIAVEDELIYCVLSNPGIGVSIQAIFSALTIPADGSEVPDSQMSPPVKVADMGTEMIYTDQKAQSCPEISVLLAQMKTFSASGSYIGQAMSGSGASCFALTYSQQAADDLTEQLTKSAGYWAKSTCLISS